MYLYADLMLDISFNEDILCLLNALKIFVEVEYIFMKKTSLKKH